MRRILPVILLSVFLFLLPRAAAGGEGKRQPVPPEAKRTKAMASVRDVYGEEFENAAPEGRRQLAELLMKQAEAESTTDAMRYACLMQAFELALESDKPELALTVARTVARYFRTSGIDLELKALAKIWRTARDKDEYVEAARGFRSLAVRALRKREIEIASDALEKFYASARGSRDRDLIKQAAKFRKIVGPYMGMLAKARRGRETLQYNPDSLDAHQAVGEYLCFCRHDWTKGLPHLSKGADRDLAALARADLTEPSAPAEQAKLADNWYKRGRAAESDILKTAMLTRAIHYYRLALTDAKGLLKTKIELRTKKARKALEKVLPYFRGPVPGGAKLFLTFEPDCVRRKEDLIGVKGASSNRQVALLHNGKLTDGVLGQAALFDGKSTYATFQSETGPLHRTSELSIACWVRTKHAGGWIIAQRSTRASRQYPKRPVRGEFMFGLDNEGRPHFWNYYRGYGIKASATKAITDGKWHHVVFACKEGKYGFYIDGKLAGTGKGTAQDVWQIPLTMGYDHRHKSDYFRGALDDVLLYDDALSEREVLEIYRSIKP
jgi:hypothetical protein